MKLKFVAIALVFMGAIACTDNKEKDTTATETTEVGISGQTSSQDSILHKDVVQIAMGSNDHSTLVAALKQANYVTALQNQGPFTVFAPTNAAFDKLPAGTLDGLMKDEKRADLQNILEYHVGLGVYKPEFLNDGQVLGMANGDNITINVKDGKITINGTANVVATISASNGIIHVVDAVLLPPAKK